MSLIKNLKIGDTVYRFDINRRVYPKDNNGFSGPIYREHFSPVKITGETSRSWIVGKYKEEKFPKNGSSPKFFTKELMEDDIFRAENRLKIVERVRGLKGADLKKIADMIGYEYER